MSICINNDLIWLSIPKCASTSIENALQNSKLDVVHYDYGKKKDYDRHLHIRLKYLYEKFGLKETICINRDYFDRWISGLKHIWDTYELIKVPLIKKWEDVDNDFIYETFTDDYVNEIYVSGKNFPTIRNHDGKSLIDYSKVTKLELNKKIIPNGIFIENILRSQLYVKDNKKCTYEFNINEIDKFEKFIQNRYNIDFKLDILNKTSFQDNLIIKDEKLKNWVWEKFEKRFIKSNNII
jgi:hypothetical protein